MAVTETKKSEELLINEVKRHLDITWNDEDTEENVKEYIKYAKQCLNEAVGTDIDYDTDLNARKLLLNHCRYQKNKDDEFFEENFSKSINNLRFKYAVKDFEEREKNNET